MGGTRQNLALHSQLHTTKWAPIAFW